MGSSTMKILLSMIPSTIWIPMGMALEMLKVWVFFCGQPEQYVDNDTLRGNRSGVLRRRCVMK